MSKKGENIYKRKDNRWEARYIKSYHPNGTPKYGYCYGKSYREAKQKVTAAKAMWLLGIPTQNTSCKQRFAFYCNEWLQLNRNRVKESTYVKYNGILKNHMIPRLGGYLLHELTPLVVEQFSNDLLYLEKLSPKTVKDILTLLHSIMQYAVKQVPESLPMIQIVYPKVPKQEMRVLSREEQSRFVQYLLNDMDLCKFGVLLSLLTGMRIGEVCALRWENISLTEKTVTIKETMQRLQTLQEQNPNKTQIFIGRPKSNQSVRTIPLTEYALELCKTHYRGNPSAFILTDDAERYVEPRLMQYRLERYTNDCGLQGVHFHTLRHTFATRCVEVDFEIKSLSEILGHSTPRITLERYVHSSIELKRSNMNKLPAIGF